MTEEQLLIPNDEYLKAGVHIGTKFKTKYMKEFIYKTRGDGLSVLNIQAIDDRLRIVANFILNYNPEDILIVARRENGWKAARLFGKITGAKISIGRYAPGLLTNPNLETFIEPKLIIATDPWTDRNAIDDAAKIGVPVIGFCDTNNQTNNIDLIMPCNNKGKKSLGLVFYILAKEYAIKKGLMTEKEFKYTIEDFMDE